MNQFQGETKNYTVDPNGASLGDGRVESIEYPCGAEYPDNELSPNDQKDGSHLEME